MSAADILTRNAEPNAFLRFCAEYKTAIRIGCFALLLGGVIWLCIYLWGKFKTEDSPGPFSCNGWGGPPHVTGALTTVKYGEYTIQYPADAWVYEDLKAKLSRFILPAGGPKLIQPGETYNYTTQSDIEITGDQKFVMPTGTQIQLDTGSDLDVRCRWTSGDRVINFVIQQTTPAA